MRIAVTVITNTNISIIVDLNSYAELNIISYKFALKYNLRRVAIKALPV